MVASIKERGSWLSLVKAALLIGSGSALAQIYCWVARMENAADPKFAPSRRARS